MKNKVPQRPQNNNNDNINYSRRFPAAPTHSYATAMPSPAISNQAIPAYVGPFDITASDNFSTAGQRTPSSQFHPSHSPATTTVSDSDWSTICRSDQDRQTITAMVDRAESSWTQAFTRALERGSEVSLQSNAQQGQEQQQEVENDDDDATKANDPEELTPPDINAQDPSMFHGYRYYKFPPKPVPETYTVPLAPASGTFIASPSPLSSGFESSVAYQPSEFSPSPGIFQPQYVHDSNNNNMCILPVIPNGLPGPVPMESSGAGRGYMDPSSASVDRYGYELQQKLQQHERELQQMRYEASLNQEQVTRASQPQPLPQYWPPDQQAYQTQAQAQGVGGSSMGVDIAGAGGGHVRRLQMLQGQLLSQRGRSQHVRPQQMLPQQVHPQHMQPYPQQQLQPPPPPPAAFPQLQPRWY